MLNPISVVEGFYLQSNNSNYFDRDLVCIHGHCHIFVDVSKTDMGSNSPVFPVSIARLGVQIRVQSEVLHSCSVYLT